MLWRPKGAELEGHFLPRVVAITVSSLGARTPAGNSFPWLSADS